MFNQNPHISHQSRPNLYLSIKICNNQRLRLRLIRSIAICKVTLRQGSLSTQLIDIISEHDLVASFLLFLPIHIPYTNYKTAVPGFRLLVTGIPSRRPRLNPRPVHVGSVVNKVPLHRYFSEDTRFQACSQNSVRMEQPGSQWTDFHGI